MDSNKINRTAEFLPMTDDAELPAVRLAGEDGPLVFVYATVGPTGVPTLKITIDTEDMTHDSELYSTMLDGLVYDVRVNGEALHYGTLPVMA